ncbi:MAG: DNA polymerase III subunit delta [Planctomycetes bacterium GWF2_41_51]|nr:MAG: DNA polymerase III subunit delta [Planctomycetes bacterium GWF2_41_51]
MPQTKKTNCKPIYVVAGKDEFLVAERVAALVNQLLTPDQMQMCLWRADADKVTAVEVFDELRTLPFLAEKRVVVLAGADDFISNNRELLEKYFESPANSGVLILSVGTWHSNTRLAKILPKMGEVIAVGEIKSRELVSYITDYASQQGKNLSYNAAQMLIEFAGEEPGILRNEIDKLATFVNSAKNITEKHISEVVGRNRAFGAFEVIDSMMAADAGKALEQLRSMFESDKDSEYTILGAFAWHFRRMFSAAALLAKGERPDMIARKLRIWNQQEFFGIIKKTGLKKIGDCLRQLAEFDYQIKTGKATAQTAIESMIIQFAGR